MTPRNQDYYGPLPDLDIADRHKLETAEGLHMLGQYADSACEVERISPEGWKHPLVLHLAARAYWASRQIPKAVDSINRFIEAAPNHPFGYVFKSQLLEYVERPRESYDFLRGVVTHFASHGTMHYQLARVAAKCELWNEARHWIYRAICIQRSLKTAALETSTFQPIRSDIESMHPGN